ncbi:ATP synthase F0 subunit B [Luteolibacter sp. Populi]|uniref:F0F1 ATP synthase subunit B family protein n=1 Tax=Luteolibacter sp. Populi TaxID=3230487 RepID=UPI003467421C
MTPILDLLAATPPVEADGDVVGEIFRTFKIDWPFFISQCVSFLIVAFLLKKFAFGPVQAMLEERRNRIAGGESKLAQIEQRLADSEIETAAAIAKANEDATRLINEAKTSAAVLSEQKAQEAISAAQQILAKAEAAAQAERVTLKAELKQEFGRLVAATTAQVTGKVLNQEDQVRINQEALASVER